MHECYHVEEDYSGLLVNELVHACVLIVLSCTHKYFLLSLDAIVEFLKAWVRGRGLRYSIAEVDCKDKHCNGESHCWFCWSLFQSKDESLFLLVALLNCDANQYSCLSFILDL